MIWFSTSFVEILSLIGAAGQFRLQIDGVTQDTTASVASILNEPVSAALNFRSAVLTAGSHTVRIQWRRSALLGTIRIDPTGANPLGHADLTIQEVSL